MQRQSQFNRPRYIFIYLSLIPLCLALGSLRLYPPDGQSGRMWLLPLGCSLCGQKELPRLIVYVQATPPIDVGRTSTPTSRKPSAPYPDSTLLSSERLHPTELIIQHPTLNHTPSDAAPTTKALNPPSIHTWKTPHVKPIGNHPKRPHGPHGRAPQMQLDPHRHAWNQC